MCKAYNEWLVATSRARNSSLLVHSTFSSSRTAPEPPTRMQAFSPVRWRECLHVKCNASGVSIFQNGWLHFESWSVCMTLFVYGVKTKLAIFISACRIAILILLSVLYFLKLLWNFLVFRPIVIVVCQQIYSQNSKYRILRKSILWESSFSVRTDGLDGVSGRKHAQNGMLLFLALHTCRLLLVSYSCARVISSVALRSGCNTTGVRRNVCRTQTE
jgi:hypothetical protein